MLLPHFNGYFVEFDPLWFNGAPPMNLLGEEDAFLAVANPDVIASLGEAVSPPVLFTLVDVLPEEFWAYTLDITDGVAIKANDSSDIPKAMPTILQARFLFIQLNVRCILYNYCKLLV
jgi:hypothetical protein